jgi:hypothetical protein
MGLLDWLTDGIGSAMGSGAGQGEAGMGAGGMAGLTPPDPVKPPGMDQPAMVPQSPPIDPSTTDIAGGMQGAGAAAPPTPMPAPRPPGADAGPVAAPPVAPPSGAGMPSGPTSPMTPQDANGVVSSYEGAGGHAFAPAAGGGMPGPNGGNTGATGILGRALGLDANRERSIRGGLGAGLKAAGENANKPGLAAFAGSAGSAMEGGQKSSDTGYDQRIKSLQLAVNAQAAGDKAAYNKNYAQYLKGKLEADTDKTSGKGKAGAWNKPDSQKFIDAQNATDKHKLVVDAVNAVKDARARGGEGDVATAEANLAKVYKSTNDAMLRGVQLDPAKYADMVKNPPGTPQNPHVVMNKQDFDNYVKPGQAYKNPADGKIYIRKGGADAGGDTEAPAAAPSPIAPPGPMPGSVAEPAEAE